eukprot:gnl/TRDRNA2_/TRDRNA2_119007_c0_seq1.p1 gnl/TRDRNA2_/TRDRNA2_119007_c0~~gnl/TRDRNA2_/TRDRNA2_119007_c0_seq1.p1  ORF type:complete len:508 (-),score=76.05 gnl/TRDRNA2_/TRDRNA2_119007_c0_seq1:64-1587(-)
MYSTIFLTLLTFTHALVSKYGTDTSESIDKLVDNLFDRAIHMPVLHRTHVDKTTLAKGSGHLALSRTAPSSLRLQKVPTSTWALRSISNFPSPDRLRLLNRLRAAPDQSDPAPDGDDAVSSDAAASQFALFADLRARQIALETEVSRRWREAEPASSVPLALNDWIRRLSLDWPLVAVGTSRGGVVVADLSAGKMLACAQTAHPGQVETEEVGKAMEMLYGPYDGNGVLAIAMRGERIASAGRDGGVRLWRLVDEELELSHNLTTNALASALILPEENGPLWAGFMDGSIRRWSSLGGEEPSLRVSCSSPVLAIAYCADLDLIAATTVNSTVELYSSKDGTPRGTWKPSDKDGIRAQSVAFMQDMPTGGWSVCVGLSDGSIHRHWLISISKAAEEEPGVVSLLDSVFDNSRAVARLEPDHAGPVVALTPGPAGLLVSGARDGSLRVWDLNAEKPNCLYGLAGYKVWLGSVCTDGKRIVADGSDNRVILHDFSADAVGARPEDRRGQE